MAAGARDVPARSALTARYASEFLTRVLLYTCWGPGTSRAPPSLTGYCAFNSYYVKTR